MQNFLTKISYVGTIALICFFSIYPIKTNAQALAVPVFETNLVFLENTAVILEAGVATSINTARMAAKETGLGIAIIGVVPVNVTGAQLVGEAVATGGGISADSIGKMVIRALIQQFTGSLIKWINSGFQGGPSFVTDPAQFFINVGDRVAGDFIQSSDLAFMCDPFYIRLALNLDYSSSFKDEVKCTLTDVVDNIENFSNDFTQGGWPAWFSMTQTRSNNPYGGYLSAKMEMSNRMAQALGIKQEELSQGGGFLSWRECLDTPGTMGPPAPGNGDCVNPGEIKTPGKVIESQLEESLGAPLKEFQLAQNFDAILGAIIGQLMKQAITQAHGLLGS